MRVSTVDRSVRLVDGDEDRVIIVPGFDFSSVRRRIERRRM
jgi:hypothetical protein